MSLFKHCADCGKETDCDWCEICSSFICEDCDEAHDCLEEELSREEFEEILLDELDEDIETPN